MAREAHPQRTAALIAIREHVARLGTIEGQRAARALFPAVGKPTWEGWCRLVRLGERAAVEQPAEVVAVTPRQVTPLSPIPPNPWGFDDSGWAFDHRIHEMDLAARALIDVAWPVDPDSGQRGRVKNPMLLRAAHASLAQTAGLVIKHAESAWNVKLTREYEEHLLEVFFEALKGEGDEIVRRVFKKLNKAVEERRIQASHGAPAIVVLEKD